MIYEKPELMFKVYMFADNKVGKKLLTSKFLKCIFDDGEDLSLTLGFNLYSKDVEIDRKIIRLTVWECGSKEQFNKLLPYYLHGSNGVILMYDITNVKSLELLSEWSELIKERIREEIPIILVGNKLDLEDNREVSKEQAESFKENYKITSSMEISVKTGENVEEMFRKIALMMFKNLK